MERNYVNLKSSFRILVEKIKEKGVDKSLLVICGDIFEYKSYLEPGDIFHYMAICTLLKKENIKTLIIPGNHDYNNNSELIIDNVSLLTDYPNIICKNKTGNYCGLHGIDDIEFHVFSPIDKKIPEFGDDDIIKIALLHEPINYAIYDNGESISDGRFNAGDLKRYDYVLLGDIHLKQFLTPRIAYSGSFVQKTKGEGIEKGYILWDIETGVGKFHAIPLKELYIRIDAVNDSANLPDLLDGQTVRHRSLFYKNCSDSYLEQLKLDMISKYGYINRIVNSAKISKVNSAENSIANIIKEDISHEKIISDLLKDDPNLQKVIDHHNKILRDRIETTCTTYKLNYLYWSNILCYGEDNYINFNEFKNNLIMLNGKNKEGKSSIIDILIRVLFNECERGYKEDIVNKSKNKGFIKFSFNIADDEYVIEQVYHKAAKKQYHRLFKNGNNITKDTIIQTYEFLTQTIGIGEYKNFVNLTTALQNRKFLVDMAPKDFISLLTKITNIDILKDVEDENRKEINTLKRMIKSYEEDLKNLSEIQESEIIAIEQNLTDLKINKRSYKKNIADINKKLLEINKDYDNTPILDDLDERLLNTQNSISTQSDVLSIANKYDYNISKSELSRINKDIWVIEGRLQSFNIADLERIHHANFGKIETPKDAAKQKISSLQNEIDKMLEVTYKPRSENFRSVDVLNGIITNYNPKELFPLERCEIDALIELNEQDQNDELLQKGLLDYSIMETTIADSEKKINNFTENFGSLEFSDECGSCNQNRSKIYGVFDIKKELGALTLLKMACSQKDAMIKKYQKAMQYKKDYELNLTFQKNEQIKKVNLLISKDKKIYEDALAELKDLENYKMWKRIETFRKNKQVYEDILSIYKEIDVQKDIIDLHELKQIKKYIILILEKTSLLKLVDIRDNNKDKIHIIDKLEAMKQSAENQLDETSQNINALSEKFHTLKHTFETRNTLVTRITNNNSTVAFLETYSKVISSKTGIPSYILINTCRNIQERCNSILSKITDFTLDIVFDKEIKIYTLENNIRIPAQMASGMQKFVMDLIFRITLTEVSSISCTKTLFVDEGFGALDKENFVNIANILQKLKENFDSLFIISHITELNTYVDITIDIKKYGYLSNVQHGILTAEQKQMALVQYIKDNNSSNKEFKENRKRIKLVEDDEGVKEYCDANGGLESILFVEEDGKLYCRGCNKHMQLRAGSKAKHIISKTYNAKHMKYIRTLI